MMKCGLIIEQLSDLIRGQNGYQKTSSMRTAYCDVFNQKYLY